MKNTIKMLDDDPYLDSYQDAPWPRKNMVYENDHVIVYKDGYPVSEGHLLYVPKEIKYNKFNISRCFELAHERGEEGIENGEWDGFNVGINNGKVAGQSVMWPHVHLIPRRKGDVKDPKRVKGGVRHVIPLKGYYEEDDKKKYKGYREWKKKIPMKEFARLEEEYNDPN